MIVVARHFETGRLARCVIRDGGISSIIDIDKNENEELWIAPAFWDVQINGRHGVSFADETLTVDQASEIIEAQASLGTAKLCPTLITAPFEALRTAFEPSRALANATSKSIAACSASISKGRQSPISTAIEARIRKTP